MNRGTEIRCEWYLFHSIEMRGMTMRIDFAAGGLLLGRSLVMVKKLTFLGIALALAMGGAFSLRAQVPLAPNAPVVSIELNISNNGVPAGGTGTEIDLSQNYKTDGKSSGGGGHFSYSISEHYEVLGYDAGHVQIEVRLTDNKAAAGKLSGGAAKYSTVVNLTKDKPVTLTPFKDTTLVLSMKARNSG